MASNTGSNHIPGVQVKIEPSTGIAQTIPTSSSVPFATDSETGLNSHATPPLSFQTGNDGVIDTRHAYTDLTIESFQRNSINHEKLNTHLMGEAKTNGGVVYGTVALLRENRSNIKADDPASQDHMIVFYATANDVFYIDAQFYLGGKIQTGEPVFDTLKDKYNFDTVGLRYSPTCHYLIQNKIDPEYAQLAKLIKRDSTSSAGFFPNTTNTTSSSSSSSSVPSSSSNSSVLPTTKNTN